jgi:hypothetical protein
LIRTIKVLFCDNEHGAGDVTFPSLRSDIDPDYFVNKAPSLKQLREQARAAGWRYYRGSDYCEQCAEDCAPAPKRRRAELSGDLFEGGK